MVTPGYSKPLKPEFLKTNPTLVVDTRHFDADFTARLVEAMGDVDEQTDGVLFHSENFQALRLMQARYRGQVKCIYIDPPYNTDDESREVNIDLLETFNWLIGLTVRHIAAPQSFTAAFERDSEKRLRLKGRLKQVGSPPHPSPLPQGEMEHIMWWFRTVSGATPDGRKTLIIWRKLTGEPEQDNLVLDEWVTKQGYSARDSEFDIIYVNGGNNLENLKIPNDLWKVRLIEEDFHRLMFETEGA